VPYYSKMMRMHIIFTPHVPRNPYQASLAGALGRLGADVAPWDKGLRALARQARPGLIVHIHWHSRFFIGQGMLRSMKRTLASAFHLWRIRRKGAKIVWTVHNLVNHEKLQVFWDKLGARLLVRAAGGIIVHSAETRAAVIRQWGAAPHKIAVIPQGSYISHYPNTVTRQAAREALELTSSHTAFLVLGHLRAYKGLDALIQAFGRLDSDSARLVIVGLPFDASVEKRLREAVAQDARIRCASDLLPAIRPTTASSGG
jgi:beta-1,4-mannosyltransferase